MGMNAAILEARRKYLGASETAVILGFGHYAGQTPDKVYWDKVGPRIDDDTETKQIGNDFEPALVHWAQRQLGLTFATDPNECFQVMLDGVGKGILAATPDGIYVDGLTQRYGLEAKAVMYGNPGIDSWGEAGTDKVPDDVLIQVHQQAAVWNLEIVFVPVLWCVGFRPEFRMYQVRPDRQFFDQIIAPQAVSWWAEHVLAQIPPGEEPPSLEVVKAMRRKQGVYIPADEPTTKMILEWEEWRAQSRNYDKESDYHLREILSRLGDAEGFEMMDGRRFTYREQNGQRRCDLEVLEQKYPDAYKELVTQTKHRTPRITGKAKTVAA